jgi:hypothetical protein
VALRLSSFLLSGIEASNVFVVCLSCVCRLTGAKGGLLSNAEEE